MAAAAVGVSSHKQNAFIQIFSRLSPTTDAIEHDVPQVTTCELECDVQAEHIVNKRISEHSSASRGLLGAMNPSCENVQV